MRWLMAMLLISGPAWAFDQPNFAQCDNLGTKDAMQQCRESVMQQHIAAVNQAVAEKKVLINAKRPAAEVACMNIPLDQVKACIQAHQQ